MYTSYFYKNMFHPNAVSIARKPPLIFKGRCYLNLAPSVDLLKLYRDTQDFNMYTKIYNAEVLSKLDPLTVFNELGKDSILLCYEALSKPCHRHLVAKWLSDSLNIIIEEI